MGTKQRVAASLLAVSIGGIATWQVSEGVSYEAIVPVKGDRPTICHGATYYEDGSRVKIGDTATPERCNTLLLHHADVHGAQLRQSLGDIPLYQEEFDVYSDFIGNFGIGNWNSSSMLRNLKRNDYVAACQSLRNWKKFQGYDCSTPGNKKCYGLWRRQLERIDKCMSVQ